MIAILIIPQIQLVIFNRNMYFYQISHLIFLFIHQLNLILLNMQLIEYRTFNYHIKLSKPYYFDY